MKTIIALKSVSLLLLCSLISESGFSQKGKVKKADEEFDSYSYIDARKIYLKVVEEGYESAQIFKKLGDTYYYNSEYAEAAKWYSNLVEKFPSEIEAEYKYRIAQSYKSIGNYNDAKEMMDSYAKVASTSIASHYKKSSDFEALSEKSKSDEYTVVNSTDGFSGSDFGPSFYGDNIVYASSSLNTEGDKTHDWTGQSYLDLFKAETDEQGRLINPIPLKGDINTAYHESSAFFTKDGKIVYFTRNNYLNGKKKRGKDKLVSLKIYRASLNADENWGNVTELPFNDDSYSTAHPTLDPNEKRLFFSSNRPGTLGESDIWYVEILGGEAYSAPVNLGPQINTEARETFPYISQNGSLYFSSDGHIGLGGLDIYKAKTSDGTNFDEVIHLKSPINTNKDDFGLIYNEEKKMGYLSSNRNGENGSFSDDIYKVEENCNIMLTGLVKDKETSEVLPGSLVILIDNDNKVIAQATIGDDGSYVFEGVIDCGNHYSIRASNTEKEYLPTEKVLNAPFGSEILQVDLDLTPPDCPVDDLGCRLELQPIYFDFDKNNIRSDAEIELAKILQALKEYPQLSIHIESHTDSRGSDFYNAALSDRRAKSTMEWLVSKGIDRSRLTSKGYGETQLLNSCSNGVDCSDMEHELNRRSVFIIKK